MAISAKVRLKQIETMNGNINNKIAELSSLKELATSITSAFGNEPVSGTKNTDRIGSIIAKIDEIERELDQMIDEYVDYRQEISKSIEQINDVLKATILYKHYFQFENFGDIATDLGYTYQWVCTVHGRALQSLDKVMKKGIKK